MILVLKVVYSVEYHEWNKKSCCFKKVVEINQFFKKQSIGYTATDTLLFNLEASDVHIEWYIYFSHFFGWIMDVSWHCSNKIRWMLHPIYPLVHKIALPLSLIQKISTLLAAFLNICTLLATFLKNFVKYDFSFLYLKICLYCKNWFKVVLKRFIY